MAVSGVGAAQQTYVPNVGRSTDTGAAARPQREAAVQPARSPATDRYVGTGSQPGSGSPRIPRTDVLDAIRPSEGKRAPKQERNVTDQDIAPTHRLMDDVARREHLSPEAVGHRALRGVAASDRSLSYSVSREGRVSISRDGNEIWGESTARSGPDSTAAWAVRTRSAANAVLKDFDQNPYAGENGLTKTEVLKSVNEGIQSPYPRE